DRRLRQLVRRLRQLFRRLRQLFRRLRQLFRRLRQLGQRQTRSVSFQPAPSSSPRAEAARRTPRGPPGGPRGGQPRKTLVTIGDASGWPATALTIFPETGAAARRPPPWAPWPSGPALPRRRKAEPSERGVFDPAVGSAAGTLSPASSSGPRRHTS